MVGCGFVVCCRGGHSGDFGVGPGECTRWIYRDRVWHRSRYELHNLAPAPDENRFRTQSVVDQLA
ncbi:MAG: hypothetical protein Q7T82_01170 [Armatimonadota bacterium]|nr:hypothetical protein [Armatimonadota bacterium]